MKKYKKFKHSLFALLIGTGIGISIEEYSTNNNWISLDTDVKAANVCFTPPKGCANLIANEISSAEESIYMHAYGLTSEPIITQLKNASKRGIKVRALLDSSNFSKSKTIYKDMKKSGIEVILDKVPGIAHNKIMIIDREKVITGSFNFTKSADTRNAENVLMIKDKELASTYLENWHKRYKSGKKF